MPSKTRWPQPVNAVVTASNDPLRFEGITGRLAFVSLICMESDTLELHDNQMEALLACYSFERLAATCLESGNSRRAIRCDWGIGRMHNSSSKTGWIVIFKVFDCIKSGIR